MEKATKHILKGNTIKVQGRFCLDLAQTVPNSANKRNTTSAAPQVRIAENHPEFAVIEVTCSCGTKTHIRCEYLDIQPADQQAADVETNQTEITGENDNEN